MEKVTWTVMTNEPLAKDVYRMVLSGCIGGFKRPGQFVNIAIDGLYLRRPISVCCIQPDEYEKKLGEFGPDDTGRVTLIYKVVGKGTEKMARMTTGQELSVLTALGNGFDVTKAKTSAEGGKGALVVGGGVGVPPMFGLARELSQRGVKVTAVLGFNTKEDAFYINEFSFLNVKVVTATADGSIGVKGFVTDAISQLKPGEDYDMVYACGPMPMLKALYNATGDAKGEFSFEERMGCGFGACMGCTCKTKYGNKRICKDGPVLEKEEIIW